MFINMEYVSSYTPTELCDFVQEATIIISNKLCPNGQINKIFFFDKVSFPGFYYTLLVKQNPTYFTSQ